MLPLPRHVISVLPTASSTWSTVAGRGAPAVWAHCGHMRPVNLLAKVGVVWKIGQGNKACQRGDHHRALALYREAAEQSLHSRYTEGEILARLAVVTELEETGTSGEFVISELERIVHLTTLVDQVPMVGRAARVRVHTLDALVQQAVESGTRGVEGERRTALAEAAEELGERGPWIDALRGLGTYWSVSNPAQSTHYFERALDVCALVADVVRESEVLGAWSVAALDQGHREESHELGKRSVELQRRTGLRAPVASVFDRFDDSARRAIVRAKRSAVEVSAPAIRVEHLLHALTQDDVGPCPAVLRALRADQSELRAAAAADREFGDTPSPDPLPFSSAARIVVQRADQEAEELGSILISTAHFLLALIGAIDGKSPQLLAAHGVRYVELRGAVKQCHATRSM